jgi:hypothetical protein
MTESAHAAESDSARLAALTFAAPLFSLLVLRVLASSKIKLPSERLPRPAVRRTAAALLLRIARLFWDVEKLCENVLRWKAWWFLGVC